MIIISEVVFIIHTGPDDAVDMSSANGLVGTGFASRYRLQPRAGFHRPLHPPSSLSLTSNRVTTNLLSYTDTPIVNWSMCPWQACAITACSECARLKTLTMPVENPDSHRKICGVCSVFLICGFGFFILFLLALSISIVKQVQQITKC